MGNLCSSGLADAFDAAGGVGAASAVAARPMKALSPTDYYAGINCYYLMVSMR